MSDYKPLSEEEELPPVGVMSDAELEALRQCPEAPAFPPGYAVQCLLATLDAARARLAEVESERDGANAMLEAYRNELRETQGELAAERKRREAAEELLEWMFTGTIDYPPRRRGQTDYAAEAEKARDAWLVAVDDAQRKSP